jgi:DNA-binding NarL/FixJ family response regulator
VSKNQLIKDGDVSVVIADDHPIFRQAIRQALEQACEQCDISEANDFDALDALLEQHSDYDMVLLDLYMPGVEGFSGLLYLGRAYPDLPVVMISANEDPEVMQRAVDYGASGYIPKSSSVTEIIEAISAVLNGDVWMPAKASMASNGVSTAEAQAAERLRQLTPQQFRVLNMMCRGLANKNIADQLDLAEATVKVHVTAIMRKLGVTNRTQAVLMSSRLSASEPANPN